MRTLWVVVVVAVVGASGCRRHSVRVAKQAEVQINVPDTPEGKECRRQCMMVRASCAGGRGDNEDVCKRREVECLLTCPGADYDVDSAR